MKRWAMSLLVLVAVCGLAFAAAKERKPKPGILNFFTKDQDIQMGKEYSAQVEKEMPVINNAELNSWLQALGAKLAQQPEAGGYPYTFKVIQDKSINAFALPGGATFTHTGLITAAENEAQIAGVLAHEISHVALRHGTNQASKAQIVQLPAMLAAGRAGGGITGALTQLGIGLGANSVLMSFSRGAESDADVLGARIMHGAGYNPIEMAKFFEKLEAESGKGSALTQFFSDHPNPGNRVKEVQEQIPYFKKRAYDPDSNMLPRMKTLIAGMPEIPKPVKMAPGTAGNPDPAVSRPVSSLRDFTGKDAVFSYPQNWEVLGQDKGEVTIAPKTAAFQNGLGYGMIANFFDDKGSLEQATGALLAEIRKSNPSMRVDGNARKARVSGTNTIQTRLLSDSPYANSTEVDTLITFERPGGVFYLVFIAPDREMSQAGPVFDSILRSVRFPN
jgi:Zn-dependent protease with chaperone function